MAKIEGLRPAPDTKKYALLEKHGISVGKAGPGIIQVDLGHDVLATIKPSDPFDSFSVRSDVRHIHLQNGGDLIMVVEAEHIGEGDHDFYLLGENSFEKVGVSGKKDLALELAVALRISATEDPKTKRLLKFFEHNHAHSDVVNHILEAKPRALDHS